MAANSSFWRSEVKKTPWFNCKTEPPVRNGWYEVVLRLSYGYTSRATQYYYRSGYWYVTDHSDYSLSGPSRPGWHKKDKWRGILK